MHGPDTSDALNPNTLQQEENDAQKNAPVGEPGRQEGREYVGRWDWRPKQRFYCFYSDNPRDFKRLRLINAELRERQIGPEV